MEQQEAEQITRTIIESNPGSWVADLARVVLYILSQLKRKQNKAWMDTRGEWHER